MTNEQQPQDKDKYPAKLFTPDGKPVRVLSTSLGVALLANAFLLAGGVTADSASAAGESADEPKLVAWSTEEVKAYFDKNVDWNIPLPEEIEKEGEPQAGSSGGSGSGGTTVINNYGASIRGSAGTTCCCTIFCSTADPATSPARITITAKRIIPARRKAISRAPIPAARSKTSRSSGRRLRQKPPVRRVRSPGAAPLQAPAASAANRAATARPAPARNPASFRDQDPARGADSADDGQRIRSA
ncbi:hypothetical protein CM49_05191 [Paenibacillus sp. P1XP2]|nr:hypothetical protein CM49_05191 [Paenibacillus sp. P1XP2]